MNRHRVQTLLGGCLLAGVLLPLPSTGAEQANAIVDALQMPAWIERQGVRHALVPGTILANQDKLVTGADARVRIQLADGSVLALGDNSEMRLNALGVREKPVFTAAIDVPHGSLRFTTGAFSRQHRERAINLRFGALTAGVRGTDLWGSADADGDRVCLLEGTITVVPPDDQAQQLSAPATCYLASRGATPTLSEAASAGQLSMWAAQAGIQSGNGEATRAGRWLLELAVLDSEAAALALYDRARAAGYAARIMPRAAAGGGYHYAVRVTQLATKNDAAALAVRVGQALRLASPRVSRY
ncbi:MAG: FecR protein [Candidatus Accumulibacter regalis]|uniref:FecR protein n=1 Tax=Accumulibacter regalis TaxID=522306 RepID=A0A011Q9W9_ACCRE|nr:FecR family protein [Accumulibacter sp.]EXI86042.1 MAG: FecR protein [Candidatus Accumulibacter regalis]HRE71265.1 FecR family protein [Accumulibacter sp.]